jgi:hypothetical protein
VIWFQALFLALAALALSFAALRTWVRVKGLAPVRRYYFRTGLDLAMAAIFVRLAIQVAQP